MKEIKLTKTQFSVFNDYDQFQLFTDDDGLAIMKILMKKSTNDFKGLTV